MTADFGQRRSSPRTRARPVTSGTTPRLYQRALEILASEITRGTLGPGARLTETHVAARFGISRAPARQALVALATRNLLRKAEGRGYVVVAGAEAGGMPPAASGDDAAPGEAAGHVSLAAMPTWERIYGEVEREIVARTSFAGWRIIEAELARHYRVSRTVARDVLGRLQQRGVIEKDDRARWQAPPLSRERVSELYELRWLLEPVALEKAAPRTPPAFIRGLRGNLEAAMAHVETVEGATLDRLELEMHVDLLGHCANRSLLQAISLPQSLLIAHRFLYRWTPRLFEPEPFLPEHMAVAERLEAGRIEEAARALAHHLRLACERAIVRIEDIARQFDPDDLPYLERLPRPG